MQSLKNLLKLTPTFLNPTNQLHISSALCAKSNKNGNPVQFLNYNKKVFPPQTLDEEPRPAVIIIDLLEMNPLPPPNPKKDESHLVAQNFHDVWFYNSFRYLKFEFVLVCVSHKKQC